MFSYYFPEAGSSVEISMKYIARIIMNFEFSDEEIPDNSQECMSFEEMSSE